LDKAKGDSVRLAGTVAIAVFVLDQATKYLVVHALDLARVLAIDVWPPFLNLRMAWNYGINFGLFAGESDWVRWVLIALALAISAWVCVWSRREAHRPLVQVSAGLLVGGALGNVVDRVVYGAVADFLNMSCCGFQNPYAFNVADITIFAGAIGLALFSGGGGAPKRRKTP
jgi:signal peptidase II